MQEGTRELGRSVITQIVGLPKSDRLRALQEFFPGDELSQKEMLSLLDLYDALEAAMTERKNILPNLDYPPGPAYHLMGFDTPTFTPLFVASRITGWTAHVMEQLGANSLIRPLSQYVGLAGTS